MKKTSTGMQNNANQVLSQDFVMEVADLGAPPPALGDFYDFSTKITLI